ncbi:hypothetical protein G3I56_42710, partial [Streptomyces sp. SID12488]|nr:hypothetical protein [Streptomyces sp. SID12488]
LLATEDGAPARVVELAEAVRDTAAPPTPGAPAALPPGALPDRLRAAVLRPLRELSSDATALLDVAAVLGRFVTPGDLALALDRGALDLIPAVQECVTAGVLVSTDRQLVFRHEPLWRAVRETVPPPVRTALRLELGERHANDGDFATAAGHLAAALRGGEGRALKGLERAGRELAGRVPAEVVALLEPAVEQQPAGPGRGGLLVPLVGALVSLGQPGR